MMPQLLKGSKAVSRGLFNNYRYLCRKNMMIRVMENSKFRRKCQQKIVVANMKRKSTSNQDEPLETNELIKKTKSSTEQSSQGSLDSCGSGSGPCEPKASDISLVTSLAERWEVDSGFSSETSPPTSGRSSPCPSSSPCQTMVVALDCEMVGSGPGGRCSELGRCSIVDYHGNIVYDKYIRPCQPVTDYRTRYSGIRAQHLQNATPFAEARDEIMRILEGKVVVGHSVYNDFKVLDMTHPCHMVRDTCTTLYFSRLTGSPANRCTSLKLLARTLLNRRIQVGRRGHCSVEDARASLDLYKLVEGEWERELQEKLRDDDAPHEPSFAASNHYMQDEYWPSDVTNDRQ